MSETSEMRQPKSIKGESVSEVGTPAAVAVFGFLNTTYGILPACLFIIDWKIQENKL
jgi:hypothetical protein